MINIFVTLTHSQRGLVNFRWVGTTGLALCGQPDNLSEWDTLAGWGIEATVNLCSEKEDNETYLESLGIEYYWLPVTDDINIAWDVSEKQANDTINWINQKLGENKKVLIHCAWGQGRAPTLAMMWYVHEGHTPEEAFSWIEQYPECYPVEIQEQAVIKYRNWLYQIPEKNEDSTLVAIVFLAVFAILIILLVYVLKVKKKWKL